MSRNETVAGYFSSRSQAESAISALKDAGFSRDEIGLAIKSRDYETKEQNRTAGERREPGTWGRVKEFFGGGESEESASSYRSEDMDTALSGLSINDERARYLRHRFDSTDEGAIVTVSADEREDEARQILERSGCDIGRSASTYDYGQARMAGTAAGRDLEQQNVQLYGEVLRVHTDRVSRGEARLRKEVHTDTQTVEVPVKREELVVERVPASGERPADSASFQEKEIRVPLSEEKARVEKQPVVREEVRVGKKEVPDTETFNEEVRSEDLKVEEDPSKRPGRKAA